MGREGATEWERAGLQHGKVGLGGESSFTPTKGCVRV